MKTVLFQGDSITDCGRNREDRLGLGRGFAPIIKNVFSARKDIEFINRGVSGDRVCHLRERWQQDCLDLKPDVLFVYVGVNEVLVKLYEDFYTPHEDYVRDYTFILDSVKSHLPSTKIIVVEPFIMPINDQMLDLKKHLVPIRKLTIDIADKYADAFIGLWDIFEQQSKSFPPNTIAEDGIHPTPFGYYTIAQEYLTALATLGIK